jgi:hypothetical protein
MVLISAQTRLNRSGFATRTPPIADRRYLLAVLPQALHFYVRIALSLAL